MSSPTRGDQQIVAELMKSLSKEQKIALLEQIDNEMLPQTKYKTPERSTSMRRPQTSTKKDPSNTFSPGKENTVSPKINNGRTQVPKKAAAPSSLPSLVRKKERVKPDELINWLHMFLETAKAVTNIHDAVGQITDKILKWK